MVFLRISLAGQVPQGSARFREDSAGFRRVPQGSAMVFLRISLAGQVPRGSARFREGSAARVVTTGSDHRGFRRVPQGSLKISL